MIYENSKYKVIAGSSDAGFSGYPDGPVYHACYVVVNKETGIEEYITSMLPDALATAASLEFQLITQPWVANLAMMGGAREAIVGEATPLLDTPLN